MERIRSKNAARLVVAVAIMAVWIVTTSAQTGVLTVRTIAGSPPYPSLGQNGPGPIARFYGPRDVAVDPAGNVYVADGVIRKISPSGQVTTFASANTSEDAGSCPTLAMAISSSGVLYVSVGCTVNGTPTTSLLRAISPDGTKTTLAGGSYGYADGYGTEAQFRFPEGLAVDSGGNIYVADTGNDMIRRITPASGLVMTVAGLPGGGNIDGSTAVARFAAPGGVAVSPDGTLWVADTNNDTIRKISGGIVSTFAGHPIGCCFHDIDGQGTNATLDTPRDIVIDAAGTLFVSTSRNGAIRQITPDAMVTRVAGVPPGTVSPVGVDGLWGVFSYETSVYPGIRGLAVDAAGALYIADTGNKTIRKALVAPPGPTRFVSTIAGRPGLADGQGIWAGLDNIAGPAAGPTGTLFVADLALRTLTPGGLVTTVAGVPALPDQCNGVTEFAAGVAVSAAGDVLVTDNCHRIRKLSSGALVLLAGSTSGAAGVSDGLGAAARFRNPQGVAFEASGNALVADSGNHTIRRITPSGQVTTFAGFPGSPGSADGTGPSATFRDPSGIAIDASGTAYVTDTGNNTIRRISTGGVVTTIAGASGVTGTANGFGSAAQFNQPSGIALAPGGILYVSDSGSHTIRRIVIATGAVTTVAGLPGGHGNQDGTGRNANFYVPRGLAAIGNLLYIGDAYNSMVREAVPAPREVVDFDGNSLGDVLTYAPSTGSTSLFASLASGGFSSNAWSLPPNTTVSAANFNDDEFTDLFLFNSTTGQWSKLLGVAGGFITEASGSWWPNWQRFIVDLDGDGISDLFLYDPASGQWFKCVSTPGGFAYTMGYWDAGWEIYPTRFNADRIADFFIFKRSLGQWFWVIGEAGPGFTYPRFGAWATKWQLHPGDFSGDGISDLLLHDPATGQWFVAMTDFGLSGGFWYRQGTWTAGWTVHVLDLDANGRSDLFLHNRNNGQWFEVLSSGNGTDFTFTYPGSGAMATSWEISIADFNGDGRADILRYNPATGEYSQYLNRTLGSFVDQRGYWNTGLTILTRPR